MESLREETEGILQMLVSLRKNGLDSLSKEVTVFKESLVAPYRVVLRYYRCDAPHSAIPFQEVSIHLEWCESFTQEHLCDDAPFCNRSRDNCAIP